MAKNVSNIFKVTIFEKVLDPEGDLRPETALSVYVSGVETPEQALEKIIKSRPDLDGNENAVTNYSLHSLFLNSVKRLWSDFEPYGKRSREEDGPDCSCGCRWFLTVEGNLGLDWGVCSNPNSPRFSLLTFEHQGCLEYEDDNESQGTH